MIVVSDNIGNRTVGFDFWNGFKMCTDILASLLRQFIWERMTRNTARVDII